MRDDEADVGVGRREEREQVELELVGRLVEVAHDDRLGAAEERGAGVHLQGAGLVGRGVDADDLDVGLLGAGEDAGDGALDEDALRAGHEHEGTDGRVGHGLNSAMPVRHRSRPRGIPARPA